MLGEHATSSFQMASALGVPLPLIGTLVEAQSLGHLTIVELTQSWRNTGDKAIKPGYTFPLSGDTQLTDLELTIDERRIAVRIRMVLIG